MLYGALGGRASNYVSAPVSREVPTSAGVRQSRSEVTLSREERDFARQIGISETEYARGKMRLPEYKRVRGGESGGR